MVMVARLYELNIDLSSPALKSRRCIIRKVYVAMYFISILSEGSSARQHFAIIGFGPSCPLSGFSLVTSCWSRRDKRTVIGRKFCFLVCLSVLQKIVYSSRQSRVSPKCRTRTCSSILLSETQVNNVMCTRGITAKKKSLLSSPFPCIFYVVRDRPFVFVSVIRDIADS